MIYTRYGTRVNLIAARAIPVWIVHYGDQIRWFFQEPKPGKRKVQELNEAPIWFAQAVEADSKGAGRSARLICDGHLLALHIYRADGGGTEIDRACRELNPKHAELEKQWRRADAAKASDLFPLWENVHKGTGAGRLLEY